MVDAAAPLTPLDALAVPLAEPMAEALKRNGFDPLFPIQARYSTPLRFPGGTKVVSRVDNLEIHSLLCSMLNVVVSIVVVIMLSKFRTVCLVKKHSGTDSRFISAHGEYGWYCLW